MRVQLSPSFSLPQEWLLKKVLTWQNLKVSNPVLGEVLLTYEIQKPVTTGKVKDFGARSLYKCSKGHF